MREKTSAMLMMWLAATVVCSLACGNATNANNEDDDEDCSPSCQGDAVCLAGQCVEPSNPGDPVVVDDPDLVSVSKEGNPSDGQSWTLLVYMIADNDLEMFGLIDLMEMMSVGSNDRFNIVVQVDRAAGYFNTDPAVPFSDWTSTKRFRVSRDQLVELDDLGEVNMGDGQVFGDFVAWGLQAYPADRVGLVMWDHGGGWMGFGGDTSHRSDLLSLSEIRAGLDDAFAKTGTERLAMIGFDACLMGNYEIARLLRPYAHYLIASEDVEPGTGWDYESLSQLAQNPSQDPEALGRALLPGYQQSFEQHEAGTTITLSMINLNKLSALDAALNKLIGSIETSTAQNQLLRARATSLSFGSHADPQRDLHLVDLGSLVARLAKDEPSFSDERDAVLSALNGAVVQMVNGPAVKEATGLTVYLPTSANYYRSEYSSLGVGGSWASMVAKLAGISIPSGSQPEFTNPDGLAYTEEQQDSIIVAGQLALGTAEFVTSVRLYAGMVTDPATGKMLLLSDMTGIVNVEDRLAAGRWDKAVAVITQGDEVSYMYLSAVFQDDLYAFMSPMAYVEKPGAQPQSAVLNKVYDPKQRRFISQGVYLVTEAGYGELTAAPGSKLYPLVLSIQGDQSQWVVAHEGGFDATQDLNISMSPVPASSTFLLMLEAKDAVGNSAIVSHVQRF